MNTRVGQLLIVSAAALSGSIAFFLRPYLPDTEMALYVFAAGTIFFREIGEWIWPTGEPDATWPEFTLQMILVVLVALWLMWLPGEPFPRLLEILPWRFDGSRALGFFLLIAFTVWIVAAQRVFTGFEQRYWRTLGVLFLGLVVIEGFLPGTQVPMGLAFCILAAAGLVGPDMPQLLAQMRGWRRRDVFGRARFEDDRSAAEKAGLK